MSPKFSSISLCVDLFRAMSVTFFFGVWRLIWRADIPQVAGAPIVACCTFTFQKNMK
jgi:hypothetical protein